MHLENIGNERFIIARLLTKRHCDFKGIPPDQQFQFLVQILLHQFLVHNVPPLALTDHINAVFLTKHMVHAIVGLLVRNIPIKYVNNGQL